MRPILVGVKSSTSKTSANHNHNHNHNHSHNLNHNHNHNNTNSNLWLLDKSTHDKENIDPVTHRHTHAAANAAIAHAGANSTPTRYPLRASASASAARTPPTLHHRSPLHDVSGHANIMRVPPLDGKNPTSNSKMNPYEKNPARTPKLALAVHAHAPPTKRTPLTPKIAGSHSHSPALATPSARRPARGDTTTPVGKEDMPTPVSAFLSHNVTPRSGPRKVRAESPKNTPAGTSSGTLTAGASETTTRAVEAPLLSGAGLGILAVEKDPAKRQAVSSSPSVSAARHPKAPAAHNGSGDSKFFHASEAKTAAHPPRPPLQAKHSTTFIYANGELIPEKPQSSGASAVGSAVGEERSQPKFFHANGTPDVPPISSSFFPPPRPSSVLSSISRTASPRLGVAATGSMSPAQRPSSPSKLNQYASLSSAPVTPRPPSLARGQSANSTILTRRFSTEAGQKPTHSRSASASSTDGGAPLPTRKISAGSYDSSAPGSPLNIISTLVPLTTTEEVEEGNIHGLAAGFRSPVMSPIKTHHSIDELNTLAANARRERKVLDLEITVSSLAAINRTLEREMRKQTAELRRYRRLSRSGRLSIAAASSVQASSETVTVGEDGEDGEDLNLLSEEEEDGESEEETSDEGSLSSGALEESDLRHRRRDEKRLQLDLIKHQQLLIDSQKMNQSLKRCLGWTEELITEGRKALEYRVRVSDVELGGRVLALDELEAGADADAEAEEADNEGMSNIGARLLREARRKAKGSGRDDRDSGIELDAAQREQMESRLVLG